MLILEEQFCKMIYFSFPGHFVYMMSFSIIFIAYRGILQLCIPAKIWDAKDPCIGCWVANRCTVIRFIPIELTKYLVKKCYVPQMYFALYDINVHRYVIKFEELASYNLYSEELWNAMKGLFLKHFSILGFAQKETISLIHDTLCAWCYRTRNEKIFLRVQEQKIFQVQILFSFNSPCTSSQYRFFSSTAFKQTRDCIQKCV